MCRWKRCTAWRPSTPSSPSPPKACTTSRCVSAQLFNKLSETLGIGSDECTEDGKFSLTACRCIGACGLAPVLTVNDDVYGRLTVDDIPGILAKYAD